MEEHISLPVSENAMNESNTEEVEDITTDVDFKKRKTYSSVWKDFDLVEVNEEEKAKCKYYLRTFNAKSIAGTSNLKRHLVACSKRKSIVGQKQEVLGCGSKIDNNAYRELMAKATIRHGYPFSWVEHKGIRDVHIFLNDSCKHVSRNIHKADCLKMHASLKQQLKGELQKGCSKISFTSDAWTSCTTNGYLSLTAHYVDKKWNLRSRLLNFHRLLPPHTGDNISEEIVAILKEWGILDKVFTMTLDNASTMDKVVKNLKDELSVQNMLFADEEYLHVRCAAHILNLIVSDGLKHIEGLVYKVRESVKYVKSSKLRKVKFVQCAHMVNVDTKKGLLSDVPTRWNSTFFMLDRALYYQLAFDRLRREDKKGYIHSLTEDEWERIQKVHHMLQPFYEFTNLLSGSKYPTANLYFVSIWRIEKQIIELTIDGDADIQLMGDAMKLKFDIYWSEYSPLLSFVVMLDPRRKSNFVRHAFQQVHGEANGYVKYQNIFHKFTSLYYSWYDNGSISHNQQNSNATGGATEEEDIMQFMQGELGSSQSELDTYFNEPVINVSNLDILMFWKQQQTRLPNLSSMARDFLSIPITTVASKSSFSMGGRVLSKYRSSLLPSNAEAVLTINNS